ncbi:MAG: DUF1080 domain-containing protein [Thermoguttaceae bacterium]
MRTFHLLACFALLLVVNTAIAADNQLTDEEKAAGWQLLFNGKDYSGWKCNNGKKVASAIEDGTMVPYKSGGYVLVHEKKFGDFILKCDVKMPEHCNSGIFFRIEELANPVHTGFEVQVSTGTGTGMHDFGAVYDLAPLTKNASKGPNVWNTVEIKCKGPQISVKLNGEPVSRINCDDFDKPGLRPDGTKHKFQLGGKGRAVKDFARVGYLGVQDHGHPVWYKNVKILPLK